ncbi:hypothetical protein ABKW28_19565, partial [Nocardioides sp. 31GB23]
MALAPVLAACTADDPAPGPDAASASGTAPSSSAAAPSERAEPAEQAEPVEPPPTATCYRLSYDDAVAPPTSAPPGRG